MVKVSVNVRKMSFFRGIIEFGDIELELAEKPAKGELLFFGVGNPLLPESLLKFQDGNCVFLRVTEVCHHASYKRFNVVPSIAVIAYLV